MSDTPTQPPPAPSDAPAAGTAVLEPGVPAPSGDGASPSPAQSRPAPEPAQPQATPEALLEAAAEMAATGHYESALALLASVPTDAPPLALGVWLLRGKILCQQKKFHDGEAAFRQAIEVDPQSQSARRGLEAAISLQHARAGASLYLRANLVFTLLILACLLSLGALVYVVGRQRGHHDGQVEALRLVNLKQAEVTRDVLVTLEKSINGQDARTGQAIARFQRDAEEFLAVGRGQITGFQKSSETRLQKLEEATGALAKSLQQIQADATRFRAETNDADDARHKELRQLVQQFVTDTAGQQKQATQAMQKLLDDQQQRLATSQQQQQQQTQASLQAIGQALAGAITLSEEVRQLRDLGENASKNLFGANAQQREEAQRRLNQIQEKVDALLTQLRPATAPTATK